MAMLLVSHRQAIALSTCMRSCSRRLGICMRMRARACAQSSWTTPRMEAADSRRCHSYSYSEIAGNSSVHERAWLACQVVLGVALDEPPCALLLECSQVCGGSVVLEQHTAARQTQTGPEVGHDDPVSDGDGDGDGDGDSTIMISKHTLFRLLTKMTQTACKFTKERTRQNRFEL